MSDEIERKFPAPVIPDSVVADGYLRRIKPLLDEVCFLLDEAMKDNITIQFTINVQITNGVNGPATVTRLEAFKRYWL